MHHRLAVSDKLYCLSPVTRPSDWRRPWSESGAESGLALHSRVAGEDKWIAVHWLILGVAVSVHAYNSTVPASTSVALPGIRTGAHSARAVFAAYSINLTVVVIMQIHDVSTAVIHRCYSAALIFAGGSAVGEVALPGSVRHSRYSRSIGILSCNYALSVAAVNGAVGIPLYHCAIRILLDDRAVRQLPDCCAIGIFPDSGAVRILLRNRPISTAPDYHAVGVTPNGAAIGILLCGRAVWITLIN